MLNKKKLKSPKIIIKIDKIENDNTDIIINWSFISLRKGPDDNFDNILLKAGSQTASSYLLYETLDLKMCDCFTTIPGLLNCNLLLNSIVPPQSAMYNTNFMFIAKCLETYKKLDNNCRFISLTIPDYKSIDEIIKFLKLYLFPLEFIREIRFFCNSEKEKAIIKSKF